MTQAAVLDDLAKRLDALEGATVAAPSGSRMGGPKRGAGWAAAIRGTPEAAIISPAGSARVASAIGSPITVGAPDLQKAKALLDELR